MSSPQNMLAHAAKLLTDKLRDAGQDAIASTVPEDLAERINKNVIAHAAASSVAAIAAGLLPGAGALIAGGVAIGAIWAMYIKICKLCGIPFGKNLLKAVASAILANVATGIAGLFAIEIASAIVPGLAGVVAAMVNFVAVYISGIIFLKLLTFLIDRYGGSFEELSEEELKNAAAEASKGINFSQITKEAKDIFKEMKKDGSLNDVGKTVDINPEESNEE